MARQLSLDDTAAPLVPERPSLPKLREAAAGCTACDLYKDATQVVFGEGTRSAEVMFVGEQPGDQEDKVGKPFVGPAGRLFDEALEDAGIDRTQVYVTNAVKHFKWRARGKRRIHQKPNWSEIAACRPWLDAELAVVAAARAGLSGRDRSAGAPRPRSSGSRSSAGSRSSPTSPSTSSRPCIRARSCAPTRRRANATTRGS